MKGIASVRRRLASSTSEDSASRKEAFVVEESLNTASGFAVYHGGAMRMRHEVQDIKHELEP
jgi:hypothetical protein